MGKDISICIVMDSLASIKPKKDSTVAMIKSAHKNNIRVFYTGVDDLYIGDNRAKAIAHEILPGTNDEWYTPGGQSTCDLKDFSAVLMRKDPPVDKRFLHACYMLEHAARDGGHVLNNPSSLIGLNEKLFATHFPDLAPVTVITSSRDVLRSFLDQHGKIIIKPLDSMGGEGVFMVTKDDVNFDVIWEIQTARGTYPVIAQEFLPAIKDGDIRVIVINGKPFEHVLVRTPRSGSIRGNMAAGGNTHVREITKIEKQICETVGKVLIERGVLFAGLDIIGDKLIEINITSPTGIRQISDACGIEIADILIDEIVKHA